MAPGKDTMGRHADEDGDGVADHAQREIDEAAAQALADTGYVYTDPIEDEAHPRIAAPVEDDVPDAFPDGWSTEPTERDQAAIDAGNA